MAAIVPTLFLIYLEIAVGAKVQLEHSNLNILHSPAERLFVFTRK
jgi:hypothetical protein